jgi:Tfp pilus assembly ATPase PilU
MNALVLFEQELKICRVHAQRLNMAITRVQNLYPFNQNNIENLKDEEISFLDLLTTRLAKLQDILGEKFFVSVLELLGEDIQNKSYIDKLFKLEKLEILPDSNWWQELRKLSNVLTHEYPDDPGFMAETLNKAFVQSKRLIVFLESLEKYIISKFFS